QTESANTVRSLEESKSRAEAEAAKARDESQALAAFRKTAAEKLQAAKLAGADASPADLLAALDKGLQAKPAAPVPPPAYGGATVNVAGRTPERMLDVWLALLANRGPAEQAAEALADAQA